MIRRPLALLLLLLPAAADDDPYAEGYARFFKDEIAGRFSSESLSAVRVVMIRGFAKHDTPPAARWLIEEAIAKDDAADVKREAVRILSKYKRSVTVEAMGEAWDKLSRRDWEARSLSLAPFGSIRNEAALGALREALKSKDERILVMACRAAGEGRHAALRGDLVKMLEHKHRAVRGAALYGLGEMGGEESLVEVFDLFCGDSSNRVRYDAWLALKKLTLEELPCDPGAWDEWWQKMHDSFAGEEGAKNPWGKSFPRLPRDYAVPGPFFGIPVMGDRVCFVLDASGSMNQPWRVDIKAQRKLPKEQRIPHVFSVKTRWDLVRVYVADCLKQLPESTEIALVLYNSTLQRFPDRPRFTKNTSKTQAKMAEFLENAERGASTAIFDGLEGGWGFIKDGNPQQNFDKGADTIVFLTDGDPTDGKYEKDPERIRAETWRVAVPRHLRIHTVGLHNHSFDLTRCLAADTGGLYVHAQQYNDPAEPQDLDFWPAKRKAWEELTKKKWKPKACD